MVNCEVSFLGILYYVEFSSGDFPRVDHLDGVGGLLHQKLETKNSQNVRT
jgi:hypothetical protein